MEHTPGPWKFSTTHPMSGSAWFVITDHNGSGPIMDVGGNDKSGQIAEAKYLITDPQEIEANARLIAAAPELLEALEAKVQECDDEAEHYRIAGSPIIESDWLKQARAAIAKAKAQS